MGQIWAGKKLFSVLLACAVFGFAAPSFAEDYDYSDEEYEEPDELTPYFDQCLISNMNEGGSDSGDMACAQDAYKYWDTELNKAYAAAQANCRAIGRDEDAEMGKQCLSTLKQMQLAWIKDRDKLSDLFAFTNEGAREGIMNAGRVSAFLSTVRVVRSQALLLKPAESEE